MKGVGDRNITILGCVLVIVGVLASFEIIFLEAKATSWNETIIYVFIWLPLWLSFTVLAALLHKKGAGWARWMDKLLALSIVEFLVILIRVSATIRYLGWGMYISEAGIRPGMLLLLVGGAMQLAGLAHAFIVMTADKGAAVRS